MFTLLPVLRSRAGRNWSMFQNHFFAFLHSTIQDLSFAKNQNQNKNNNKNHLQSTYGGSPLYREPESSSLTLPPWGTPTSTSWVTQQGLHKGNHFLGTGESRSFPQETLLLQLGSQSDTISLLLWGPEVLATSMVAPLGTRKTTSTKAEVEH